MRSSFLAFAFLILMASPAAAQLVGNDTAPGDSCAGKPAGATRVTADADANGADVTLICDGSTWNTVGVRVYDDLATCDTSKSGTIRYESGGDPPWEYCNGSAWVPFEHAASGGGDPTNCDNIGDTCSDGTIYAGDSPDGNVPMYTTPADAPSLISWNDGTGNWADTAMDNCTDGTPGTASSCQTGEANTAFLIGATGEPDYPFAAAEYCDGLSANGHDDWYLPASDELDVLYDSKNAGDLDGTFDESDVFPAGYYWSSSEGNYTSARSQRFGDGTQTTGGKSAEVTVRCVRKSGGGLSGPAGCANIGDLCADGTVFAGYHPITQEHLFIPTTDQGTTSAWKTSTGTDDIATDSDNDGQINDGQVANSATFPAFKLCKDLTTGGHSDWYLPSRVELYYIWSVRDTIEAGGNITNFQNVRYWSSTEYSADFAWRQYFTYGYQNTNTKSLAYRVRCVRR